MYLGEGTGELNGEIAECFWWPKREIRIRYSLPVAHIRDSHHPKTLPCRYLHNQLKTGILSFEHGSLWLLKISHLLMALHSYLPFNRSSSKRELYLFHSSKRFFFFFRHDLKLLIKGNILPLITALKMELKMNPSLNIYIQPCQCF